jgi:hypothetical protein
MPSTDDRCKLCGGETEIRTTPYRRYRDCHSCGESWVVEEAKVPVYQSPSEEIEPPELTADDERIHELGG